MKIIIESISVIIQYKTFSPFLDSIDIVQMFFDGGDESSVALHQKISNIIHKQGMYFSANAATDSEGRININVIDCQIDMVIAVLRKHKMKVFDQ